MSTTFDSATGKWIITAGETVFSYDTKEDMEKALPGIRRRYTEKMKMLCTIAKILASSSNV